MNENTITIARDEYENLLRTLGRADACVSFLMHEYNVSISHYADAGIALELLGVEVPQTVVPNEAVD